MAAFVLSLAHKVIVVLRISEIQQRLRLRGRKGLSSFPLGAGTVFSECPTSHCCGFGHVPLKAGGNRNALAMA